MVNMVHEFSLCYVVFAEQKSTFTVNHSIAPKVYSLISSGRLLFKLYGSHWYLVGKELR